MTTLSAANLKKRFLHRGSPALVWFTLIVLLVVFSAMAPGLFTSKVNVSNILSDASILIILSVAATMILAVGDFDLSIGAVLVFSGVLGAKVMIAWDGSATTGILLGLVVCLVTGGLCGALSGALVAYARIPSIITTLGVMGLLTGASNLITGGVDLRGLPTELTRNIGNKMFVDVLSLPTIIAFVVAIIVGIIIRSTVFGRNTLALGSNAEALRRVGVDVRFHRLKVFALAGMFYGLAGFLSLAKYSTTTIAAHGNDMLQAYTAAILGGSSPFGGVVTVVGTVVGVFIPTTLQNGFVVLGIDPFWQQVAVGAVLLVAVFVQTYRKNQR
jgi:ribose transport system permease protein